MKRTKPLILAALIAAMGISYLRVAIPIIGTAITIAACKSTPARTAYTTAKSNQDEIAANRIRWADYVIAQRTMIGAITDRSQQSAALLAINDKELKVKAALEAYLEANKKALDVLRSLPKDTPPPVPTEVIETGNNYLATVKALLPQ